MALSICASYDQFTSVSYRKIGNDQELIQSDPISRPQNQKGKKSKR